MRGRDSRSTESTLSRLKRCRGRATTSEAVADGANYSIHGHALHAKIVAAIRVIAAVITWPAGQMCAAPQHVDVVRGANNVVRISRAEDSHDSCPHQTREVQRTCIVCHEHIRVSENTECLCQRNAHPVRHADVVEFSAKTGVVLIADYNYVIATGYQLGAQRAIALDRPASQRIVAQDIARSARRDHNTWL